MDDTGTPLITSKKSHKKVWLIILIILVVLLAAATSFFAVQYFQQKSKVDDLNSQITKLKDSAKKTNNSTSNSSNSSGTNTNNTDNTPAADNPKLTVTDETQIKTAYEATGNDPATLNFSNTSGGNGIITNSSVSPYQTITLNIKVTGGGTGGSQIQFFRVNSTAPWRYFFANASVLDCSMYDQSSDTIKAFADVSCLNSNLASNITQSTVKTYFSSFLGNNNQED
ncbi:hypothetical protein FWF48_02940 [Candidatus Saccharibacteria bacterium]|nr:hypothetical protein [Candidatus Saccharibacteria bacterium]